MSVRITIFLQPTRLARVVYTCDLKCRGFARAEGEADPRCKGSAGSPSTDLPGSNVDAYQ